MRLDGANSTKKILLIDCSAGITGEKFLGALIDLGADPSGIKEAVSRIQCLLSGCVHLHFAILDVKRCGIGAKLVKIIVKETYKPRKGWQMRSIVKKCVDEIGLSKEAKAFPLKVADTLLNAEAKIHREAPSKLCLHELGSAKVIALLAGISKALDDMGLLRNIEIYSTPPALGRGFVRTSHGILTVPTPATLQILSERNIPSFGGPVKAELTTPLGAAILVNLADHVVHAYPLMKPKAVGYGAGKENYEEVPNILRTIFGKSF